AGMPDGLRERSGFDRRLLTEQLLETGCQAESRRVPERVHTGAARDEQPRNIPAGVANGVGKRGANGAVGRLDIGASIDQRTRHVEVVAARGPMQWGFCITFVGIPGVGVPTRVYEHPNDQWAVREVTGPVRDHVEWRATPLMAPEPRRRETRVLVQEFL